MTEDNKIEIIKEDAIIVIKFNREYYMRLTYVLQSIIEDKTPEQMEEAAAQFAANEIKELWIANYQTILYLIKSAEEYCQHNGLTEMKDVSELRPPDENLRPPDKD